MKAFLAVTLCAYLVLGTLVQAHEINSPAELKGDPHCPPISEGHNATLFPHPTNCSAYYECDNGEAILMDCPSGLHFNPELLVCDYVWNAGCQKTRADPRCPNPGSGQNVTFIPNPNNCSQYFECDNGNIIVMDCPSGLHFNPELLVCDHIWNAGCQKTRGDPRCPPVEEGQNVTLIPNPSNCSQFFECVGEEIVVMDCPEGLHFNPELLVCDHIWNAGCQKTRGDLRCPPTSEGHNATLFPHPSNCSLYYECNNGEAILMKCPPDLYFNPVLLVCDFDWEAGCEAESGRLPTCPKPGTEEYEGVAVFPNPRSCSRYFECDNGKLLSMKCPSGLHFNPSKLVCDHKRATGCNV